MSRSPRGIAFQIERSRRHPCPPLVPDLVVEILSESNTPAEMKRKRSEYFDSGVRVIWEVDPAARTVHVHVRKERSTCLIRRRPSTVVTSCPDSHWFSASCSRSSIRKADRLRLEHTCCLLSIHQGPLECPSLARTAVPARSRSCHAAVASSSKPPAADSGCSVLQTCWAGKAAPAAGGGPLSAKAGHLPAKAKRCIFLFMTGGPSQMDLFDPKPLLNRLDSQPLPPSFGKIHSQFLEADPLCLGSHRKWGKYGQSGMDMSDLVPHLHPHADDIALIRSCYADSVIHAPAMYQMNTGRVIMGFPSLGSWVTYGLGSESDDLPAYVVMTQPEGTPEGGAPCWGAGFLPAHHQGTLFRPGSVPIVHLKPPDGVSIPEQRGMLDLLRSMNEQDLDPADTELSRGSRPTSWPSGCRVPRPRRSTSPASPNRPGRSMAWTILARSSSAPAACWRAGWSSAACVSCSFIRAAVRSPFSGMPTKTSTPTTRRCAG